MKNSFTIERIALFASLFFFAFGIGLMVDGKKLYANQLKMSQRVNYKSTLNPYL
ncbi:MAG: hypothetical protein H7333_09105 [Bdellovibrionales bacterium]|nr:hypothetical protein [Oligoflexia bacterium]